MSGNGSKSAVRGGNFPRRPPVAREPSFLRGIRLTKRFGCNNMITKKGSSLVPVVNTVKPQLLARAARTGYKTFDGFVEGLF